jgi:hypothetical protein
MLKMHETTKVNIEHMNAKYKISGDKGRKQLDFEPGDLVRLHLRKERFPDLRKSKLMPRADVLFKALEKINENSYKLELRTTQMQEGEDDVDINTSDTSHLHIIRFLV